MSQAVPPSSLARSATVVAASAATATSSDRRARTQNVRLLLAAFALLLAIDWWWPFGGVISYLLLAIVTALCAPWAVVMLRKERGELVATAGRGAQLRRRLLHVGIVLLLGCFLVAKWLVLVRAAGRPEFVASSHSYSLAIVILVALGLFAKSMQAARLMAVVADHPARLIALSFGTAGVLGAALLSLPISLERLTAVSLVDNLFMAFSAVCVTGLSVNSVPDTYSFFGQVVLCVLMQIGGLGIMVLSAAFALIAGQRLRVKSSAVIAQMVDATSLAAMRRTVLMIVVYTFVLEAIGALLLHAQFRHYPELAFRTGSEMAGPGSLAWASIFHAVSAFCSGGISNVRAGFAPFVGDHGLVLTLSALVILGGLGFPVLDELFRAAFNKLRGKRLPCFSLHTRVALAMSGGLLVAMTLVYLVLEWGSSMSALGPLERLTAAFFQSASSRSAGFNVVDVSAMQPAVLTLTCAAMFVGASPGSTGGGIKTTTVAVLFSGMRAELKGETPRLLNRQVPDAVVRKAIGVTFLSFAIVLLAATLLLLLEDLPPLALAFEATSAFTTTGLSTGITPELSTPGKLLIIVMMYAGRIGPLTLALVFSISARARAVELPQERVLIG